MIRLLLITIFLTAFLNDVIAQDSSSYANEAKILMNKGDFSNAILLLNKAIDKEPDNIVLKKDIGFCYYFQNDYQSALSFLSPLIDSNVVDDDQCYQIAGDIFQRLNQPLESEKIYKKGISKFPESGALYNELGVLLWEQGNEDAINYWEKGIETEPNYSKNYYNAANYYFFKNNWVWCIIYGETFVNLESFSKKTPEVKALLWKAVKQLYSNSKSVLNEMNRGRFTQNYIENMFSDKNHTVESIHIDDLIMNRTKFVLSWFNNNSNNKFPFKLFEYHQELLQKGLFEAYNEWLFGSSENLSAFQNWTQNHYNEYNDFISLQKSRIYKIAKDQYYH